MFKASKYPEVGFTPTVSEAVRAVVLRHCKVVVQDGIKQLQCIIDETRKLRPDDPSKKKPS